MNTQKLPVGIDNFEKLRKEEFYYVDKTGLIIELMQNWGEVNLFTRPRRFGKTLNMSMLKYFFEVGGDKSIFEGLRVAQEKELCEAHMGKYPVVFISLKGVDGLTFEDAYDMLTEIIRQEAIRLQFLLESDKLTDAEKQPLSNILNRKYETNDVKNILKILSALLEKHYGQKVILLIDEYDVPLDKAYHHGYYDQMIDLIRAMFGAALKTNDSLFFAVLTGCLRVSKESIFTGLNNLKVHSISDVKYDEYFGFTDEEVHTMLDAYDLGERLAETREWYDGYRFGGQDVYCPWDVINYCDDLRGDPEAEPRAYWLNTSSNSVVRSLIDSAKTGTLRMEIEELIAGKTITKRLNEQLTHNEIFKNIDHIWSLLYMTGYLTIVQRPSGGKYALRIPNHEIRQIFISQVMEWFQDKTEAESDKLVELYKAFENGDAKIITEYLNRQLIATVSFYDAHESFYHGFLLALLNTCANWQVTSNAETGMGRSDIIAERDDGRLGFVVEVKDVKDKSNLEAACETAMKQIEDKDYTAVLRRYGVEQIWTYGIAFCGKRCHVMARKIT